MLPVVSGSHADADLSKMKFLVLALCVCAASAASYGRQPQYWQRQQQQGGQAYASAAVSAPQLSIEPVQQPLVKNFGLSSPTPVAPVVIEPAVPITPVAPVIAVAKTIYNAPIAAAKAAINFNQEAAAEILRQDNEVSAEGFNYAYETQNGIAAQSIGNLKNVNNEPALGFEGSYQYTSPEGSIVQVSYIADENGFQPRSDWLPVGPPTPEHVIRALEYIRTHPQKEEKIQVLANIRA